MNPFSLSFGKEPVSIIDRDMQKNTVYEGFTAENPESHVYMITGVRGSGKTVLMTEIANRMRRDKEWIVAELSPERDIIHALAAELSNRAELMQLFKDAKINLSLLGFGIEIDAVPPITDIVVALDRMLAQLTKRGKKILIALDETVSNKYVREFSSQFQIFVRKNYNVFLLMTGLYENIYELQNESTLTFLYRAPKIVLKPLNNILIAKQYQKIFSLDQKDAMDMAGVVKGYPYAYQVLGYLCYKKNLKYTEVLDEFDAYLSEYVYEKIWSELSSNDRTAAKALAQSLTGKTEEIRALSDMSSGEFSVYRDRLIKKGVVASEKYGYLEFTLPRFKEFVYSIKAAD